MTLGDLVLSGAGLAAGFVAGAINSVAGGGTMISFPILVLFGLPPLVANATNTVGIWPGSIGSVWGFRGELRRVPKRLLWLLIPAGLGGLVGAYILRLTPPAQFGRIVPYLLLSATLLFFAQPFVKRVLERGRATGAAGNGGEILSIILLLAVAIYGGYFGAGMSILMLSILGVFGLSDMLLMTATTSLLSVLINGSAGALFSLGGLVEWSVALPMAFGSVLGGYLAAGWARKVGGSAIRRVVLAMGVVITIYLFIKR